MGSCLSESRLKSEKGNYSSRSFPIKKSNMETYATQQNIKTTEGM